MSQCSISTLKLVRERHSPAAASRARRDGALSLPRRTFGLMAATGAISGCECEGGPGRGTVRVRTAFGGRRICLAGRKGERKRAGEKIISVDCPHLRPSFVSGEQEVPFSPGSSRATVQGVGYPRTSARTICRRVPMQPVRLI